ncbi:MAG: thiol:disulfide interchange protein DsbA/DsbL [Pseudomonadota bacterium]|nr:thiol:disulfide interchange protein DsbA/DsbL [Pseudomonadota bacterium]
MSPHSGLLPRLALAMLFLLPSTLVSAAAPAASQRELVAGVDYIEIPGGAAFSPEPGKIEVVEVFGYTCNHCAHFEPQLSAWVAKLPADVQFTAIAAPFGGMWIPYAKAYYAAQSLGLDAATHDAMFRALHEERSLPLSNATPQEIAGFYARHGGDPQKFVAAMSSSQVESMIERARAFIERSGVDGTPSLVVNGKYRVIGGKTYADALRITERLIDRERAQLPKTPAKPSPAVSGTPSK